MWVPTVLRQSSSPSPAGLRGGRSSSRGHRGHLPLPRPRCRGRVDRTALSFHLLGSVFQQPHFPRTSARPARYPHACFSYMRGSHTQKQRDNVSWSDLGGRDRSLEMSTFLRWSRLAALIFYRFLSLSSFTPDACTALLQTLCCVSPAARLLSTAPLSRHFLHCQ